MGNQLTTTVPTVIRPIDHYLAEISLEYHHRSPSSSSSSNQHQHLDMLSHLGQTQFFKVIKCGVHNENDVVVDDTAAATGVGDGQQHPQPHLSQHHRKYSNYIVVKVLAHEDPSLLLDDVRQAIQMVAGQIAQNASIAPYHRVELKQNFAYLTRAYIRYSLYDRLLTRPFLSDLEKRWILYQLCRCMRWCHQHRQHHCHGDIKTENIMLTTSGWMILTDFATHLKPVLLPDDDPTVFNYYFDTTRRRCCNIAPERFAPSVVVEQWQQWQKCVQQQQLQQQRSRRSSSSASTSISTSSSSSTLAAAIATVAATIATTITPLSSTPLPPSSTSTTSTTLSPPKLTPPMDMFSIGCVCAEIFSDTNHTLFDLSTLLAYYKKSSSSLSSSSRSSTSTSSITKKMAKMNINRSDGDGDDPSKNVIDDDPGGGGGGDLGGKNDDDDLDSLWLENRVKALRITNPIIERLVINLIQASPADRLSAAQVLQQYRYPHPRAAATALFPGYFDQLYSLMQTLCRLPPDSQIIFLNETLHLLVPTLLKEEPDGMLVIFGLICATLRSLKHIHCKVNAQRLLCALTREWCDDYRRSRSRGSQGHRRGHHQQQKQQPIFTYITDRLLPYFVDHFLLDSDSRIRAETIRSITTLVSMIDQPQSDYNIFSDYILPSLCSLANREQCVEVRLALATSLGSLAASSLNILNHSDWMDLANYTEELNLLQDYFQRLITTLLTTTTISSSSCTSISSISSGANTATTNTTTTATIIVAGNDGSGDVRRALLLTPGNCENLCKFFGPKKTADQLLSHFITFLNDKIDFQLRAAFFTTLPIIAAHIEPQQCVPILLPLLEQGLTDSEESVIAITLHTIVQVIRVGQLLPRTMWYRLLAQALPLVYHPNRWLVNGVAHLLAVLEHHIPPIELCCKVVPLVTPYTTRRLYSFTNTYLTLDSFHHPLARSLIDQLLYQFSATELEILFKLLDGKYASTDRVYGFKWSQVIGNIAALKRVLYDDRDSGCGSSGPLLDECSKPKLYTMKELLIKMHQNRSNHRLMLEHQRATRAVIDCRYESRRYIRRIAQLWPRPSPHTDGGAVIFAPPLLPPLPSTTATSSTSSSTSTSCTGTPANTPVIERRRHRQSSSCSSSSVSTSTATIVATAAAAATVTAANQEWQHMFGFQKTSADKENWPEPAREAFEYFSCPPYQFEVQRLVAHLRELPYYIDPSGCGGGGYDDDDDNDDLDDLDGGHGDDDDGGKDSITTANIVVATSTPNRSLHHHHGTDGGRTTVRWHASETGWSIQTITGNTTAAAAVATIGLSSSSSSVTGSTLSSSSSSSSSSTSTLSLSSSSHQQLVNTKYQPQGRFMMQFYEHSATVTQLSSYRDGGGGGGPGGIGGDGHFISSSLDGSIRLWNLPPCYRLKQNNIDGNDDDDNNDDGDSGDASAICLPQSKCYLQMYYTHGGPSGTRVPVQFMGVITCGPYIIAYSNRGLIYCFDINAMTSTTGGGHRGRNSRRGSSASLSSTTTTTSTPLSFGSSTTDSVEIHSSDDGGDSGGSAYTSKKLQLICQFKPGRDPSTTSSSAPVLITSIVALNRNLFAVSLTNSLIYGYDCRQMNSKEFFVPCFKLRLQPKLSTIVSIDGYELALFGATRYGAVIGFDLRFGGLPVTQFNALQSVALSSTSTSSSLFSNDSASLSSIMDSMVSHNTTTTIGQRLNKISFTHEGYLFVSATQQHHQTTSSSPSPSSSSVIAVWDYCEIQLCRVLSPSSSSSSSSSLSSTSPMIPVNSATGLITGGTDSCIRYWDINSPERCYMISDSNLGHCYRNGCSGGSAFSGTNSVVYRFKPPPPPPSSSSEKVSKNHHHRPNHVVIEEIDCRTQYRSTVSSIYHSHHANLNPNNVMIGGGGGGGRNSSRGFNANNGYCEVALQTPPPSHHDHITDLLCMDDCLISAGSSGTIKVWQ